jgi:selenide,water dikinase
LGDASAASEFKNLLVGRTTSDDAAVMDMGAEGCLIATNDFFTPMVDDPFRFGRIAAANALSDVYAMGGNPIMALGILGWPVEQLGTEMAARVMQGAEACCTEAGIPLAGGHSIASIEPFFGLAANGWVKHENLRTNAMGKPGHRLFITKPIGVGIFSAAYKRGMQSEADMESVWRHMETLNRVGAELGKIPGVGAITDVTGFGLVGHLLEICRASHTAARLHTSRIPLMPGLHDLLAQWVYPDSTTRNYQAQQPFVSGWGDLDFLWACDPQTNGGLLISVSPEDEENLIKTAQAAGVSPNCLVCIGELLPWQDVPVMFSAD